MVILWEHHDEEFSHICHFSLGQTSSVHEGGLKEQIIGVFAGTFMGDSSERWDLGSKEFSLCIYLLCDVELEKMIQNMLLGLRLSTLGSRE